MKTCAKCREAKPLDAFWRNRSAPDGRQAYCQSCHRASRNPSAQRRYNLKSKFRLTSEQYDAMLKAQGNGCAICGTETPGGSGSFHVDHDHSCCAGGRSCGKCVRGLLCHFCNTRIVVAVESPYCKAALAYLEKWAHDQAA